MIQVIFPKILSEPLCLSGNYPIPPVARTQSAAPSTQPAQQSQSPVAMRFTDSTSRGVVHARNLREHLRVLRQKRFGHLTDERKLSQIVIPENAKKPVKRAFPLTVPDHPIRKRRPLIRRSDRDQSRDTGHPQSFQSEARIQAALAMADDHR